MPGPIMQLKTLDYWKDLVHNLFVSTAVFWDVLLPFSSPQSVVCITWFSVRCAAPEVSRIGCCEAGDHLLEVVGFKLTEGHNAALTNHALGLVASLGSQVDWVYDVGLLIGFLLNLLQARSSDMPSSLLFVYQWCFIDCPNKRPPILRVKHPFSWRAF